ncbi:hypothetical protein TYRP_002859 [Tyrophagus putrescentiae]|nr:hypothetical protein TYRP_002859 [Tyrophagus putrescentiae]
MHISPQEWLAMLIASTMAMFRFSRSLKTESRLILPISERIVYSVESTHPLDDPRLLLGHKDDEGVEAS